ncbi:MAG TPA: HIT domain-containing protein [Patescibacteria group bacterium]|nr:HIT domain-containing protein [Patescibacteria group bacterium]
MDCLFCKIRDGKVPAKFVYEDSDFIVFPDIHPVAKTHLLIVPKKHIPEFIFLEDKKLQNRLFSVIQKMISESGLKDNRYRIGINGGGLQDIDHLHVHLMGPLK